MPRIPEKQQMASLASRQELQVQGQQPFKAEAPKAPPADTGGNPFIPRINLGKHDVPVAKIFEQLMGKPMITDQRTGITKI